MALPLILYNNLLESATTLAATDTGSGYDIDNVTDWRPYTLWVANGTGVKIITADLGSAQSVDTLGIAGHNFGSTGVTASLESSATGAFAGEETICVSDFSPTDDRPIIKTFASASARYWRLLTDGGSAAVQIGVLALGPKLEMEDGIRYGTAPLVEEVEEETARSKAGHQLGSIIRYRPVPLDYRFRELSYSFVNGTFYPFWNTHAALRKPFFIAHDITNFPEHSFFAVNEGKLEIPMTLSTRVEELRLQLRAIR